MDALMAMRKQANEYLPDNEKLSVNDFILKAVALTLRQFPNLNATIKGNEVIQFGHVNVGVGLGHIFGGQFLERTTKGPNYNYPYFAINFKDNGKSR